MARKLVVCCDGTWNRPDTKTNVHRTFTFLSDQLKGRENDQARKDGWQTVSGRAADGSEAILFYDQGVGTSLHDRLTGGAVGAGLSKNVCEAYHFLSRHYRPGSEIYVFGFSRGAYTARSLCGLIAATRGLLRDVDEAEVARAYLKYYVKSDDDDAADRLDLDGHAIDRLRDRIGDFFDGLRGKPGRVDRDLDDVERHDPVKIRFVGVYDTVGALGIPTPKLARITTPLVQFHNQSLGPMIEHAVHALAVDERRGPYRPTIWSLPEEVPQLTATQSCLQVWFPGVHSDVGGGYADPAPNDRDRGIGDITWHFMMEQARKRGLALDPARAIPKPRAEPFPRQHDSFNAVWKAVSDLFEGPESLSRPIGDAARKEGKHSPAVAAGREMLHPSLVERVGQQVKVLTKRDKGEPTIKEGRYDPVNLKGVDLPVFAPDD